MSLFDLFQQKRATPQVSTILPDIARQEILRGRLPILNTNKIFLRAGEQCHYIDKAIYEKRTIRKRYVRRGGGYSTRGLFKGTRVNFSRGTTDTVDNVTYSTHRGILYITNRRIIFVGDQIGFDKKLDDMVALTPYNNCVEIQFTKETYTIFVPDGTVTHAVLQKLR